MTSLQNPLKVFISYSHKDKQMKEKLILHLSAMIRQKYIMLWYDNMILPGKEIDEEILKKMRSSQIVLLLLSADYLASEYCYDIEMHEALMLRSQKKMEVIPILLRPVDLKGTLVDGLMTLPEDRQAITLFQDEDEAYKNVTDGIRRVVEAWYSRLISNRDDDDVKRQVKAKPHHDNYGFEFYGSVHGGNYIINNISKE